MKLFANFTVKLIVFLSLYFAYGQNSTQNLVPILDELSKIEKQHSVVFTYANKTLEGVFIFPINESVSLSNKLLQIEKSSHLRFTIVENNNILININTANLPICGYLIDFATKNIISDAHISVLNSQIHTISNNLGFFSLGALPKNQVLVISHISYPTLYLNSSDFLKKKGCLTLSLTQSAQPLNEVVLTNYLTKGIILKTDNSISLKTQEYGILPGLIEPDVLQKIQSVPGISSSDETISNINIRGGTNDQNLLLWDGIKMYHSGHFFGLISAFNPYLTEKVTLIKNGTSPQYNDGVSGVVSIESVDSISENVTGGAGFNLLSVDGFVQIPLSKKMGIQFAARRSVTDFISTPTFENYFKRAFQDSKLAIDAVDNSIKTDSEFDFSDYSFKFLYNLNKRHKFRANFLSISNSLAYTESNSDEAKTSTLNQVNNAFGFKVLSNWNTLFTTELLTYYTKYNIDASNYSLLTEQRLIQNNQVIETGVKLNSNYTFSNTIQWVNGYHYYELGVTNIEDVNTPLFIRRIKHVIRNHALFSELKFKSNNSKTTLHTGLRFNYIEKFGKFLIEPRLQFMQKLHSNLSFKLGGEFKSQNVTQIIDLQEDFLGVAKTRWVLADNGSIPIISSKQASAGFNFKKNSWFVDIEGFYKLVNGITTSTQGFQNQNQFVKTHGSYLVKGVEFLINKKTNRFSSWLGYTFNNNTYTFKELTPSRFPNNLDIHHEISLGNTFTYNNLNLALGLRYKSGKPHTIPIESNAISTSAFGNFINYESPNSSRLPNYFRADFSTTYHFDLSENMKGFIGVSVLNFLNTKNTLNTYYKILGGNSIKKVTNYSLNSTPNVTFRVTF